MASLTELENRVRALELIILGAVTPPIGAVFIDDAKIADKTGWTVFGWGKAGINGGLGFEGVSSVAAPTTDADFDYFTSLQFE